MSAFRFERRPVGKVKCHKLPFHTPRAPSLVHHVRQLGQFHTSVWLPYGLGMVSRRHGCQFLQLPTDNSNAIVLATYAESFSCLVDGALSRHRRDNIKARVPVPPPTFLYGTVPVISTPMISSVVARFLRMTLLLRS